MELKNFRNFLLLWIVVVTVGCTSIPISTMIKYSNADESLVQNLSPSELRVRAHLDGGFMIDSDKVNMILISESENGEQVFSFGLSLLEDEFSEIEGGWLSNATFKHNALFKLSEQGALDLVNLQKELQQRAQRAEEKKERDFDFSVNIGLKENEQVDKAVYEDICGGDIYFSIWIKPNAKEEFVHLFDEAPIELNCKNSENSESTDE